MRTRYFFLSLLMTITYLPALHAAEPCEGILIRQNGAFAVAPGDLASYEIRVVNVGNCSLKDVVLTDFIPRRSVFAYADPSPSLTPAPPPAHDGPSIALPVDRVEWSGLKLAANGSELKFVLRVRIDGASARTVTNTACLEHEAFGRICDAFDTYVKGEH